MARPTYTARNALLRKLGFSSYQAYLTSDLWRGIKTLVLNSRSTCILCGEPGDTIHHIDYEVTTLTGENLSRLAVLCSSCHYGLEFTDKREKRLLADVQNLFKLRLRRANNSGIVGVCKSCGGPEEDCKNSPCPRSR